MWWRKSKWKRSSAGRSCSESKWKRSSRSCSGKSTANLSASLDRSQHRCSSIESLLSLEQSLVTYDDENNLRLIPLVCLQSNNNNNNIPAEVDVRNGNREGANANPIADKNNEESTVDDETDANIGLDISGKNSVSEREDGEAEMDQEISLDHRPCQSSDLPMNTIDQGIPFVNQSEEKKEKKPTKQMRSILKTHRVETLGSNSALPRDTTNQNSCVRFGVVEVHEHELELGGSSVPLRGPPVGLGWKRECYRKFPSVQDHLEETHLSTGGPRPFPLLHQPSEQRVDKLLDLGYTLREIRSSAREAGIVRTKRIQSARYSSRNKCFVVFRKALREIFLPLSNDEKLGKKTVTSEYTKSAKTRIQRSSISKRA